MRVRGTKTRRNDMLYKKTDETVLKTLEAIEFGSIRIELHDGRSYDFVGRAPGPAAHLCIHAPDVLWNMAIGGDTAFARDYQAGKWDSDDIGALVDFAFRNDDALGRLVSGNPLKRSFIWLAGSCDQIPADAPERTFMLTMILATISMRCGWTPR